MGKEPRRGFCPGCGEPNGSAVDGCCGRCHLERLDKLHAKKPPVGGQDDPHEWFPPPSGARRDRLRSKYFDGGGGHRISTVSDGGESSNR